jgi:raffinose/stachyose/melibiose transport system permease protein
VRDQYSRRTLARELALVGIAALFCLPFYILVVISLDSTAQTYRAPLSLPSPAHPGNFSQAWRTGGQAGLGHALGSSLIITLSSVVGLIVLGSLCAYVIARRGGKLGGAVYVAFVVGIILPIQLALIPLFVAMRHLGLVGNYLGMIVLNVGLFIPLTVFLYTGFIRALPRDYEEAAQVDGATTLQTYVRVVFPLLLPVTATAAVLVGVAIWNEFFVSLIFLGGSRSETVPVALYSYVGDNVTQQNLIFAGLAITIAPILLFYLFAQRHLIRGFAGGIKG